MYKLVAWALSALAAIAIIFGFTGAVGESGLGLLISVGLFTGAAWLANLLFAKLYGAATNAESALITGLILFFLFSPPDSISQALMLVAVAVIAMASKYLVAYRARHIFNPAAFAAVVAGLIGFQYASWWVATAAMVPFVIVAGLLVLRKTRRTHMFVAFYAVAFGLTVLLGLGDGLPLDSLLENTFISFPLLFLGAFMLTEPLTTPPTRPLRYVYAVLVGVLVASGLSIGNIFMSPELALVIGNVFAYTTTLRQRVRLRLVRKTAIAPDTYQFSFTPERPFAYQPGQYMEVTLPVPHADVRGNRRTFTIASSPTEQDVQFGIKFAHPGSTFKQQLQALPEGGILHGVQVAGDFLLPRDAKQKLVFIAGGIGVTPFRSQLKWLADTQQTRDIVLLYAVNDPVQVVYQDVFEAAKPFGLKVVFVLGGDNVPADWTGETGFITAEMVQRTVPDYAQRSFYISGPPPMVAANKRMLKGMGVRRIKTDYFSGY
jgi:ferredoxin-NADP reductase/Na+-translocating ferredoxin:NAD+ oxidoreductase RnfD subunit